MAVILAMTLTGCGTFTEVEKSMEEYALALEDTVEERDPKNPKAQVNEIKSAAEEAKATDKEAAGETKAANRETTTEEITTTRPERYIKLVYYADVADYIPISTYEGNDGWVNDSGIWDYVITAADWHNTYVAGADYFLGEQANYYGDTDLYNADYYGYYIDKYETHDRIFDAVKAGEDTTVYVAWCGVPSAVSGWENVPDTYLAVSIAYQYAWFFKDGYLYEATNVVTGLPTESRATPTGVFSVQNKGTNTHLTGEIDGEKWDETVNYWMGITDDGVGIHDAHWRGTEQWNYGGSIYQYNGSHGCINLPYYSMQNIWDNSYIGMTVIVY